MDWTVTTIAVGFNKFNKAILNTFVALAWWIIKYGAFGIRLRAPKSSASVQYAKAGYNF